MLSFFHSGILFCAAIVRPSKCGYCAETTGSKWYDVDLRAVVCGTCFNPALDAERELLRAKFRVPPAALCRANP